MKQLLMILGFLSYLQIGNSQFYFPSSNDKPIWSASSWQENMETGKISYSYAKSGLIGDTLINNTLYSKLYTLKDSILSILNAKYVGGLRRDTLNKVYFLINNSETELLLYDFSKDAYDTIWLGNSNSLFEIEYVIIESVDTITLINGEKSKQFHIVNYDYGGEALWIEGIGSKFGLLSPFYVPMDCMMKSINSVLCGIEGSSLLCYYQNNELIYKDCKGTCFPVASSIENVEPGFKLVEIYPNPAFNTIYIENKSGIPLTLGLINIMGKQIRIISINKSIDIDISDLPKGFYIANISSSYNNNVQVIKLLKR